MARERKLRGKAAKAAYFIRTASGEYIYNGPLYKHLPDQKRTWRQAMARRWIFSISILALILLCGFLPVQGMVNSFYVIIPYACSLVCAAMLLWGVIQISDGEKGLREYVYKSVVGQLPIRAAATGIFAGLTLVGEGIFLFREGASGTDVAATALFCLAEGAVLVMSLICRRMEKDILWGK